VLLVGPHCTATEPPSGALVVAVDVSDECLAVLPTAAEWANRLGLRVHVVTVAQCGNTGRPDARADAAHELVDDVASKLQTLGVDAERHVLNSAYPADSIVAFATGLPAAFIATGTHGAGRLTAKALGSVADQVVRHSPCPVLVRRVPH
jgi:nucleotide-binding universal stress UspA family protein